MPLNRGDADRTAKRDGHDGCKNRLPAQPTEDCPLPKKKTTHLDARKEPAVLSEDYVMILKGLAHLTADLIEYHPATFLNVSYEVRQVIENLLKLYHKTQDARENA